MESVAKGHYIVGSDGLPGDKHNMRELGDVTTGWPVCVTEVTLEAPSTCRFPCWITVKVATLSVSSMWGFCTGILEATAKATFQVRS